MKKIFFIRHGATAGNLQRRYIGRTDEPLCAEGTEQVLRLKERDISVDIIYTSPMLRARQTAELLFPGREQITVEDLRETDFGIFEGKTADELAGLPEYQHWVDSMCLDPIPGGDSVSGFKARCCNTFEGILEMLPEDSSAAIVTHGGVIMAVLEACALPKRGFYDYHVQPGSMLCCEYDGTLKIVELKAKNERDGN